MKTSKVFLFFIAAALAIVMTACSSSGKEDAGKDASAGEESKTITVGTSPGPYSALFMTAIKPILEKKGYEIKAVDFTELLQADIALTEGSVDLNVDQHSAYMNNFNAEKGAKLVKLNPIPTVPAGIFPGSKSSLEKVADGDTIGIPQDPSNAARAYALLQKANWIKLKEGVELVKATSNDIAENPHNLNIMEMDSAQLPRSLQDMAYAVLPGSIAYSAKIDMKTALLSEDVLKDLELVAVVDAKNKDTQWAKDVTAAYKSDEFKQYMKEHNQNGEWFIPEELK